MNKIANVVYSGWMVKSPPEQKFRLKGAWKIFRAKWKRRFFVLFKPGGSLPHQYVLNYYSDENCRKLKGYIDLEHCEQIIESLDLDLYPFLLAIKTYHKSKERTYFLATDTEDQMTTWVRNLCSVCGLKPEDNPSEIPPDRAYVSLPEDQVSPAPPVYTSARSSVPPVMVQPRPNVTSVRRGPDGEAYTALSDCYSGKSSPPLRQDSVDSIPDEPAPPPPGKMGPNSDLDNEVFHPSTYDTPKSREIDSVYKVPPPRNINNSFSETEPYDVPPPRPSPSTPRSSSSESQKADSAYSSQSGLTYDYPPNHGPVSDDTYDIPPANPQPLHGLGEVPPAPGRPDAPPARPPKPNLSPQEPYQNLPATSKVFSDSGNCIDLNKVVPATAADVSGRMSYDVPRSCAKTVTNGKTSDSNLLVTAVPPPPPKCIPVPVQHNYINAAKGHVPRKSESDDNYLPMDGPDGAYQDMSGRERDAYTDMSTGPQGVYDTPPARPPPVTNRVSPKPSADTDEDTCTIFSNSRTRSFKRNPPGSPATAKRRAVNESRKVELPSRCHFNNHPDNSSSEDEEENHLVDPSQVMMPYYMFTSQQHSQVRLQQLEGQDMWTSTPPAPKNQEELKYVDLELDKENEKQPPVKPSQNNTSYSPHTEYKEIDFIKTEALKTVKKDIAEQRKHEDP